MFDKRRYYSYKSHEFFDNIITLKSKEEVNLFIDKFEKWEMTEDEKNPEWMVAYFDADSAYEVQKFRDKIQTLRKKRGMHHHWTEEDAIKAIDRLNAATVKIKREDIKDIKSFCTHVNKLTEYFEAITAVREIKERHPQ